MIRLAWRQFRTQAAVAFAALAALAIVLAITGAHLAHLYDTSGIATCKAPSNCDALKSTFLSHDKLLHNLLGPLLLAVPALLGIFWGAPLVARELETGTYRLAWTQSVTRTRWLAVKVALIGLCQHRRRGTVQPHDHLVVEPARPREHEPVRPGVFDERGIVPIGYAAFAFALGLTAGALIRRTVPAMATTLVAFAARSGSCDHRMGTSAPGGPRSPRPCASARSAPASAAPAPARTRCSPIRHDSQTPGSTRRRSWTRPGTRLRRPSSLQGVPGPRWAPFRSSTAAPANGPVPPDQIALLEGCVARVSAVYHEVVKYLPAGRPPGLAVPVVRDRDLPRPAALAGLCVWWVRRRLS